MRHKYPKTPHLPFSDSIKRDDRILESYDGFKGRRIVITLKMDGECTTMYPDFIHARSIDSGHHPSRAWVKSFHAQIAHQIPEGWRICGENLYAKHTIPYTNLDSYFLMFSMWEGNNNAVSWEEVEFWSKILNIPTVPVLYRGTFRLSVLEEYAEAFRKGKYKGEEGFVVRINGHFHYDKFDRYIAKYVRKNHVQTDQHWMHKKVIPNLLKENHHGKD